MFYDYSLLIIYFYIECHHVIIINHPSMKCTFNLIEKKSNNRDIHMDIELS